MLQIMTEYIYENVMQNIDYSCYGSVCVRLVMIGYIEHRHMMNSLDFNRLSLSQLRILILNERISLILCSLVSSSRNFSSNFQFLFKSHSTN